MHTLSEGVFESVLTTLASCFDGAANIVSAIRAQLSSGERCAIHLAKNNGCVEISVCEDRCSCQRATTTPE